MKNFISNLLLGYTREEIENNQKLEKLHYEFIFWIGDYMHNFGCSTWFNQSEEDLIIKKGDYLKIKRIFLRMKSNTKFVAFYEIEELINDLSLKEEFLISAEEFYSTANKYEKLKLYYQLILLGFRQILPIITSNNYSFNDISPSNVKELQEMDSML